MINNVTQPRRLIRVGTHLLFWLSLYAFERYYFSPSLLKDNETVVTWASVLSFLQTIAIYYSIGYVAYPKFLYRKRYGVFLLMLGVIFLLIYQTNRVQFTFLVTLSGDSPIRSDAYVPKIAAMLTEAGWFGCFTSLRVFFWNYAYSFFVPTIILFIKAVNDVFRYQQRLRISERERYALELSFLKSQVNPHFLFNTLNSVYGRVFETDEQAADLVLRLSELMRYNLYEADGPRISLEKELAYIQNYLDLERNRLQGEDVLIEYEQEGDPASYQIAPLLLIAFVENAFKHGIKGASGPAFVQVRAAIQADTLRFMVENSVPLQRRRPDQPVDSKRRGGVGLLNVKRRLDAIYLMAYDLSVTAGEYTYRIELAVRLTN
ncbi:hypothetical protein GCM10023189_14110 [Nibrella saemangeumensis]|uniref:Signal transduction histidine kinase internal region domain-containing protein n=1 Tax=Nibrella saemangeumensis TaxID=1084526 RepID=A0ABP8MMB7_9BACT